MGGTTAAPPGALTVSGARRSYLKIEAAPSAVPSARRHTRHMLTAWNLHHLVADAELVVSELMTNAVQATVGLPQAVPVALYLAADDDRLTLLVWDSCPELPEHRPHDEDATGGRGLEIIEALSDRYGTCVPDHGGKVVWARFDLPRP